VHRLSLVLLQTSRRYETYNDSHRCVDDLDQFEQTNENRYSGRLVGRLNEGEGGVASDPVLVIHFQRIVDIVTAAGCQVPRFHAP
jgi:hypothetical protein